MSRKKRNISKINKIFLILIIIIVIVIGILLIKKMTFKKTNKENVNSTIVGTFLYGNDTKYSFDSDGKGAMYVEKYKFDYSYKTQGNKLIIDFVDEKVHDATYSYQLDNNTLKLVGEAGTAGGEYALKRK